MELDYFTQAYIATALTLCSEELGANASRAELAPAALAALVRDCLKFQVQQAAPLAAAYAWGTQDAPDANWRQFAAQGSTEWFEAQAAQDFWLTRNGHGTGFWDRENFYGADAAELLSAAASAFGEADLYRGDDNLIYHSPA